MEMDLEKKHLSVEKQTLSWGLQTAKSFLVQWFSRDSSAPKSTPACVLRGVSGVSGFGVEEICSGSCEQCHELAVWKRW